MNKFLVENNYVVIENFINKEDAERLYNIFKEFSKTYPGDPQSPESHAVYNFIPFVELLVEKIPVINDIIGEPVLPTYSFARVYKNGADLKRHTDRDACEVSVSLNLGGDKDWDIYFKKPNGEESKLLLKPGQAVLYAGCVSEHWREKFDGTEYGQVFLHYVRSKGFNNKHFFDRLNLNQPQTNNNLNNNNIRKYNTVYV
jgi:hypothetical protein